MIQVNASKHGLGTALIQIDPSQPKNERIVAFVSKSLSDVEQRYANIECELLAVVFGIEKFHQPERPIASTRSIATKASQNTIV